MKAVYSSLEKTNLRATEHHLPHGITQLYLPPNITTVRQVGTQFNTERWADLSVDYIHRCFTYLPTVTHPRSNHLIVTRPGIRADYSITNQIKFDLRFTDLWSTWCSELIVDQLCCVFPCSFDLQLRDRRLVDRPSTEPNLCKSD